MGRNDEARRIEICSTQPEVRAACPLACGECCGDDPSFLFENDYGEIYDCEMVGKRTARKTKWCATGTEELGSLIYYNIKAKCPKTCDFCFDAVTPVSVPIPAPAPVLAPAPAPAPFSRRLTSEGGCMCLVDAPC